jgi:hypothetical protein
MGPGMQDEIRVRTDLFEHREVKPHFINPRCFGEDFVSWLLNELTSLRVAGFEFSEPIQEDYGWGFWAKYKKDTFWIALGICDDESIDALAEWQIFVNYDAGLNIFKRLFHNPDTHAFSVVRDRIWDALRSNPEIKELPPEG